MFLGVCWARLAGGSARLMLRVATPILVASIARGDKKDFTIASVVKDKRNKIQRLKVNTTAIESILLHPSIKDKEVMIIGITGVFRSGKSFTLNLLDNQLRKLSGMVSIFLVQNRMNTFQFCHLEYNCLKLFEFSLAFVRK